MAGKLCPNCGNQTLFATSTGRKCTKCSYEIVVPTNGGKGGKGRKCPICGKYTLHGSKCTNPQWGAKANMSLE